MQYSVWRVLVSHALLTMGKKMYFLKLSVITHVFHSASADAGTLLTGDLIESFSEADRSNTISL